MSHMLINPYKQELLDHAVRVYLRVPDTFNQGDILTVNVYDERAVRFRVPAGVRAGSNIYIDVNDQTFNNSQTVHQWIAAAPPAVARAQQQQLLRLKKQNQLRRQQEAAPAQQTPHPHPPRWHQQPLRRVAQPAGHVLAAGL